MTSCDDSAAKIGLLHTAQMSLTPRPVHDLSCGRGEQRSIPKSLADGLTQIGKVAGAIRPIRPTHAFVGLGLLPPDRRSGAPLTPSCRFSALGSLRQVTPTSRPPRSDGHSRRQSHPILTFSRPEGPALLGQPVDRALPVRLTDLAAEHASV